MKKSTILLILGIIVVFTTVFFVFFNEDKEESVYFKNVIFKKENTITNSTGKSYLDTIIRVALDLLDIENQHVMVMNLNKSMEGALGKDIELKAHVKQYDGGYIIFLSDVSRMDAIYILSHECIHISQYVSKRLIVSQDVVFWNDSPTYPKEIAYEDRPWEVEAFQMETRLVDEVLNSLY